MIFDETMHLKVEHVCTSKRLYGIFVITLTLLHVFIGENEPNAYADGESTQQSRTLDGRWQCVSALSSGATWPKAIGWQMVIAGGQVTFFDEDGQLEYTAQIRIDSGVKPARIDLEIERPFAKEFEPPISLGVFRFVDSRLELFIGEDERPEKAIAAAKGVLYTKWMRTDQDGDKSILVVPKQGSVGCRRFLIGRRRIIGRM